MFLINYQSKYCFQGGAHFQVKINHLGGIKQNWVHWLLRSCRPRHRVLPAVSPGHSVSRHPGGTRPGWAPAPAPAPAPAGWAPARVPAVGTPGVASATAAGTRVQAERGCPQRALLPASRPCTHEHSICSVSFLISNPKVAYQN